MVAKWPGSAHDSFVFTISLIHERLESNHVLEDGYLLGVSGYSCKAFLMTPYPNTSNAKAEAFNKAHCKTRVLVQSCTTFLSYSIVVLMMILFIMTSPSLFHIIGLIKAGNYEITFVTHFSKSSCSSNKKNRI